MLAAWKTSSRRVVGRGLRQAAATPAGRQAIRRAGANPLIARIAGTVTDASPLRTASGTAHIPPYAGPVGSAGEEMAETDPDYIDVRELIARTSPGDLRASADAYFQQALSNPDPLLTKPYGSVFDLVNVLTRFSFLVSGLQPLPEMTVLDFGAGTCWSSRILTQLGCAVIATDISPTALELGAQLFRRSPVLGDQPSPRFLVFDGETLDLPDASVDRISCADAFHHVVNPERVLSEMARVLKPGGVAGFSEPGLRHSRNVQAQYEMRTFGVVENDVDLRQIAIWAQKYGLSEPRVAVGMFPTPIVSLDESDDLMTGGPTALRMLDHLRAAHAAAHLFFLHKGDGEPPDSRQRHGLRAAISLSELVRDGHMVTGTATVVNAGEASWRASSARVGPVRLGVRVVQPNGTSRDIARAFLPDDAAVRPGAEVQVPFSVDLTGVSSDASLLVDMVSDGVTWFVLNGSETVTVPVADLGPR